MASVAAVTIVILNNVILRRLVERAASSELCSTRLIGEHERRNASTVRQIGDVPETALSAADMPHACPSSDLSIERQRGAIRSQCIRSQQR